MKMASPTTFLFPLKLALIATGAVSIAMAVKVSVPLIIAFFLYDVPILWSFFQTWMKPPYLFFIINGIIIIIAATSRVSNQNHESHPQAPISATGHGQPPVQLITIRTPPPSDVVAAVVLTNKAAPAALKVRQVYDYMADEDASEAKVVELKPVVVNGIKQLELEAVDRDDVGYNKVANYDALIVPKAEFIPSPESNFQDVVQLEFVSPPVEEKSLVLSSFSHTPKPTATNPPEGGRAVRVVGRRRKQKEQQQDTIENTWKMINRCRHVPVTRPLRRPDPCDSHGREVAVNSLDLDFLDLPPPTPASQQVSKSATFRDRTNYYDDSLTAVPEACKMRKEPSLSQEEINRRAEEFIKKFNEEMRLQRQESLKKHMDMINRGI